MYDVSEGDSRGLFGPFDLSFECFFDVVDGACGAVVVEEVVAIDPVVDAGNGVESVCNGVGFVLCEVEHLFGHVASFACIISGELSEGGDPECIVSFSEHKAPSEVGCGEIEYAVVEDPVGAVFGVSHSQRRMAV